MLENVHSSDILAARLGAFLKEEKVSVAFTQNGMGKLIKMGAKMRKFSSSSDTDPSTK